MGKGKLDLLQGTLDLMVLRTLDALGPLHGYGIHRLRFYTPLHVFPSSTLCAAPQAGGKKKPPCEVQGG